MTGSDKTRQPKRLTVAQLNAIDLLAAGLRDGEVADHVKVSRQAVNGWRNRDAAFRAALNARRAEVWTGAVDRLRAMLPTAMEVLAEPLERERDSQIALALVRLAGVHRMNLSKAGPATVEAVEQDDALREQAKRQMQDVVLSTNLGR